MALDTFIAGAYSASYAAADVGVSRTGYDLQHTPKAEMVDETDAYGLSTVDWIYRGGDAFVNFTSRAYKAGSIAAFWPYGALGVISTSAAPIARLASAIAGAFVLSATANTPAATSPASLTANLALLAPNFDARLLYDSRLRDVPCRLQLLPFSSSGIKWYTLT